MPSSDITIRISDDSGVATLEVAPGTPYESVLVKRGVRLSDVRVSINRQTATPGQTLNQGDNVSVNPKKVEGNRR